MGLLGDSKKRFLEPPKEKPATPANPDADLGSSSSRSSSFSPGISENPTFPELTEETKKRIAAVVRKLVGDCLGFYQADQDVIEQMSQEGLEIAVLDFLSKRDWYRRGLTEEPLTNERHTQ